MATADKLLGKLTSKPTPRDFPWSDLVTLLRKLGYQEISGNGSRLKFIHTDTRHIINLHEPHPDKNLRVYQVGLVVDSLKEVGLIK